jgi:hypothetical protein
VELPKYQTWQAACPSKQPVELPVYQTWFTKNLEEKKPGAPNKGRFKERTVEKSLGKSVVKTVGKAVGKGTPAKQHARIQAENSVAASERRMGKLNFPNCSFVDSAEKSNIARKFKRHLATSPFCLDAACAAIESTGDAHKIFW